MGDQIILRKKKHLLVAWQQLSSPQITVAMASLGFDWLVVDLEHTSITTQEAEAIFIAAATYNCKPFARLTSADPYLARRCLDAGAVGLLVPVVESLKEFDEFAEHCFFPPTGKRGLGLTRSNLWGDNLESYFKDFKPIIIAQIETIVGAKNINNIIKSKFLDGIMVGPYDLSASLNMPGKFNDPEFVKIKNAILKTAKKNNKLIGFHQVKPDLNELKNMQKESYDFIAYGTDVVAMRYALKGIQE